MITKRNKSRKIILVGVAILALFLLFILNNRNYLNLRKSNDTNTTTQGSTASETINYEPPTEQERQEANIRKEQIIQEQVQNNSSTKFVTPIITDAGKYDSSVEVSGFMPGIIESDGTCVVTFKKGLLSVNKTVKAIPDASSTHCTNVIVSVSEFTEKGIWDVTISYSSSKSKGSSEAKNIDIQ